MIRIPVLVAILSFVLCNVAGAQNLEGLHVGSRIRVQSAANEAWAIGTYEGGTKDSLWIGQCDRCGSGQISFENIRELDVSMGAPRSRSTQVVYSTLIGLTVGLIGGAIAPKETCLGGGFCLIGDFSVAFVGALGGVLGAAVGGIVPIPREHWLKILPR